MENRGPEDADLSLNIEALSTEMIYHLASTTLTKSIFKMNHRNQTKNQTKHQNPSISYPGSPKRKHPGLGIMAVVLLRFHNYGDYRSYPSFKKVFLQ